MTPTLRQVMIHERWLALSRAAAAAVVRERSFGSLARAICAAAVECGVCSGATILDASGEVCASAGVIDAACPAHPIRRGDRIFGALHLAGCGADPALGAELADTIAFAAAAYAHELAYDRTRAAIDAIGDSIYIVDRASMRFIDVNVAGCKRTGYAREQVLAMGPHDLLRTERKALERSYDELISRDGRGEITEAVAKLSNGREALVELRRRAIRAGDDWVIVSIARDITEQRAMERALKHSEERFRRLTMLSSDWYWEQDREYRYTMRAGRMTDDGAKHHEDAIGKERWNLGQALITPQRWAEHKRDVLDKRLPFSDFEYERIEPDGSRAWVSISGEPMFDEAGEFTGYRGIGRDITARKQTEAAIEETRDLLDQVINALPGPMMVKDEAGRYLIVNEAHGELMGRARAEFLGRTVHDLFPPELAQRTAQHDAMLLASGQVDTDEHPIPRADGTTRVILGQRRAVTLKNGRRVLIAIGADVTALREATEAARAASRAKSEFLATMSHEIRTPMNGVLGMAELLLDSPLEPTQQRFAENIRRSGEALLAIINDILDFSKIEAGRMEIESIAFDPRELVREVVELHTYRARAKGLVLECELGELAHVHGDPGRIRQVLMNLVGNAIKFTAQGRVTVALASVGSGRVRFSVADTGIGIAPAVCARLFTPFTQADGSMARQYGGTGLGLAISRRLVELMGGSIDVESVPGAGARFWFDLPLRAGALVEPAQAVIDTPRAPIAAQHVLVAEDNVINQEMCRAMLTSLGCTVEIVANGIEALRRARAGGIDLVLMDCQMPEMDGFAATRALRAAGCTIPIIALTANAMEGDRERCLDAGMDDYLSKPFRKRQLETALARWSRATA